MELPKYDNSRFTRTVDLHAKLIHTFDKLPLLDRSSFSYEVTKNSFTDNLVWDLSNNGLVNSIELII